MADSRDDMTEFDDRTVHQAAEAARIVWERTGSWTQAVTAAAPYLAAEALKSAAESLSGGSCTCAEWLEYRPRDWDWEAGAGQLNDAVWNGGDDDA